MGRFVALAGTSIVLAACSSPHGLPPFWEREFNLPGDLDEDRAVFGFASKTRGSDGALLSAIRPFMAMVDDAKGTTRAHYVPPIGSHAEGRLGRKTTIWPIYFDKEFGDETDERDGTMDNDTWIMPILGWGSSRLSHGDWFMVFPFYGQLRGTLVADKIDFVMFPAYAQTQTGDWHSTHILWPLIAWGESPTRSHWRFLPFWSQSDSPNRRTRTLLWPIGHWDTEIHGSRTFDSWFVFPLLGHRTSRDGDYSAWTVLYPFFQFAHDNRTGDATTTVLFPVYKHVVIKGKSESTWYWPFYGHYDSELDNSAFYAWPIVWSADWIDGTRSFHQRFVVPVWMKRSAGPKDGPLDDEELRSWPLFSWRRRGGNYETLRVPEIIPFFGWEAGETCYADLLTLFKWSADKKGREAWDLPLGVIRYRRDDKGAKTLTLLWWISIPLGGGR